MNRSAQNQSHNSSPRDDDSVTTTSDDASSSSAPSVDDTKLKLAQMKRANRSKVPQSKLLMKFKNFISPEQRAKNELNKRIDTGVRACLMLHTATELSSICGVLGLRSLERATSSIDQIISYCKEEDDFSEPKVLKTVNNMWEGALFEYLKSIGHPALTSQDPKLTVMKIWRQGGFHEYDSSSFTPHYIKKHILTRHDNDLSEDISRPLSKLKQAETVMKYTERELFEEHNYTNALLYFQQLGDIRRMETELRDYLIHQLESIRTDIDRAESNVKLGQEMIIESEERYIKGYEEMIYEKGIIEVCYEDELKERLKHNQLLFELKEMVEQLNEQTRKEYQILHHSTTTALNIAKKYQSYLSSPESNLPFILPHSSSGSNHSSTSLSSHPQLHAIHTLLLQNHQKHRQSKEILTDQLTGQSLRILQLQTEIQHLNQTLEIEQHKSHQLQSRLIATQHEVRTGAKQIIEQQVNATSHQQIAWKYTLRLKGQLHEYEEKLANLSNVIQTAIQTKSPLLRSFCFALNNILSIVPTHTLNERYEGGEMAREDERSEVVRQDLLRAALLSGSSKLKKKKKLVKKGGKKKSSGSSKKPSSSASSKKPGSAKSVASSKPTAKPAAKKTAATKKKK